MENNIQEIIIICGVQEVCRGSRATGELTFQISDDAQEWGAPAEVAIPVCEECYQYLEQAQQKDLTQDEPSDSVEQ